MDLSPFPDLPGGAVFHLSRAQLRRSAGRGRKLTLPHLLWVQNGAFRMAGFGSPIDVSEGGIVFLREGMSYALRAREDETWVAQLAIRGSAVDDLRKTYGELDGRYFWSKGEVPEVLRLDRQGMSDLAREARELETAPQTALSLHAFLLPLFTKTQAPEFQLRPDAPDWLRIALAGAQDPEVYRNGAAGFVARTGRAHAHVSRTVRAHLGCSPSELINHIRMTQAARMLSSGDEALTDVAEGVGINNLSHFHRLFRAQHGMTPAAYRTSFGRGAIQPR